MRAGTENSRVLAARIGCTAEIQLGSADNRRWISRLLYFFINKTCSYPVAHPDIITNDFADLSTYFRLGKIKVLPPRGLLRPVLGVSYLR
jgi:hypothetical protein